jgi:putative PIN family toxin of toxin-antitoxin system
MRYHVVMSIPIILLDTNIFISALLGPTGASREIIRKCLKGCYQPIMGNTLFREYEDLLQRRKLFRNCILNNAERNKLFDSFLSVCLWVSIYYGWRPNLKDEGDNHLIELAVAGGAQYLVTKNTRDFINPELRFPQFQIVRPEKFLKEV